jgi:hypothetical protein
MIALMTVLAMQVSPPAGEAGGQESPEELVRQALEKEVRNAAIVRQVNCEKETIKRNLNDQGNSEPEKNAAKLPKFDISIQKLLRSGRYIYKDIPMEEITDFPGRIVSFVPAQGDQPGPDRDPMTKRISREERALNWVINRIQGLIYLDQQTGGIRKIEAWLPKEISFLKVGYVYQFRFEFDQQFLFGIWAPQRIMVKARYNLNKHGLWLMGDDTEYSEEYTTLFSCMPPPPP